MFERAAGWCERAAVRPRLLAAFAAGASLSLAFAPIFFWPVIWAAFPVLFWLLQGRNPAQRFWTGWCFGFGHFLTSLYWISISLLTDPERFAWLIPFALFGLNAAFALFIGLMALMTSKVHGPVVSRVLGFAVIWVAVEYLRSHLLTGFPWNLIGYVWADTLPVLQLVSLTGVYALGLLTVLTALVPVLWLGKPFAGRRIAKLLIAVWAIAAAFGFYRLNAESPAPKDEPVTLRIVQANIPQHLKWQPEKQMEALEKHIALSQGERADIVIWPESALPFTLTSNSHWPEMLAQSLKKPAVLITGTNRGEGEPPNWQVWNSIVVIGSQGELLATYDKHHLVPFGEFVPLSKWLPLEKITHGAVDFSRGPGPQTIAVHGVPSFSPLVCYEAIFPTSATNPAQRPEWLLNLTNDAWFGDSSGPHQHLAMARARAVEQGIAMVRAANTGISAVFDAKGRVVSQTVLGEAAVIEAKLPPSVPATLYSKLQETITILLLAICVFTLIEIQRRAG